MITGNWEIMSAIIAIIFCFFLLNKYNENKIALTIPSFLIWFLILMWGLFITLKSPSIKEGIFYYTGTIFVPFLIFIIFCNIKISKSFLRIFFNLLIISGVLISLVMLYIYYISGFDPKLRLTAIWLDYNILSAYLMILFMFNISFIINKEKDEKLLLYIVSIIFLLLGIFLTQTRGVWLAIVITTFIFFIRKPKIIIPSIIFIGVIIFLFFSTIQYKFLTVKYFGSDYSSLGRLQAWISTLILIKDNFLFGYGFDSYIYLRDQVFPFYFVDVLHSHNTYLRTILEMGFIGFVLYFYFIFSAFIYLIRPKKIKFYSEYKKFFDGFLLSFIALFIVFMFEPYFSLYGLTTIFIWILISIVFNFRQISRKQKLTNYS